VITLDVVVIDYRTPDLLKDFVDSYAEHSWPGCTLTVADVDPVSGQTKQLAADYVASYIGFDRNVGYGRACNESVTLTDGEGEVILLANADTRLSSGLIECVQALMTFENWGALGPRQVNEVNQIVHAGIVGHERSPHPRAWNEIDYGQHSYIDEDVLSISGSLYFIKRTVWNLLTNCELYRDYQPDANGPLLETPHYFEETWCSYHMRAHGYRTVFYGPVQMIHLWHKASPHGGWADQQFRTSQHMHRTACAAHGIICE
jgi:GT2 family glycosyltransferase